MWSKFEQVAIVLLISLGIPFPAMSETDEPMLPKIEDRSRAQANLIQPGQQRSSLGKKLEKSVVQIERIDSQWMNRANLKILERPEVRSLGEKAPVKASESKLDLDRAEISAVTRDPNGERWSVGNNQLPLADAVIIRIVDGRLERKQEPVTMSDLNQFRGLSEREFKGSEEIEDAVLSASETKRIVGE